ncbi:ATP-binding cassette domain-containing protein [Compostimonas suwonensis]|uniref:Simple sugar transport system ATP-binding protein n=1 Tax=Compostimonas suwonensis TaxID=1048394 RepID=A0A2M9C0F1_9MICO|nr:ATP-binding cassette domain-containing protein [Compostimonas suwonensis]PJJ63831.1 simple sugar transport system ATP-binding protein [Compostimonas suwonensis]
MKQAAERGPDEVERTDVTTPVLEAVDLRRSFGSVEALRGASLTVKPREVVALIGDNGAGKSTLVRCLSGADRPDSGRILVDGGPAEFDSPVAARAQGIETLYQDLAVATDLDAATNMFLGRELYKAGFPRFLHVLDKARMRKESDTVMRSLGVEMRDARIPVRSLSGGQRQIVAVARAVTWAKRVVFMDEPTAALGVRQRALVLDAIRRVRDHGISVVLVSHNMPEVLEVADRVEVLRLGRRVARFDKGEASVNDLVGAMTGALVTEPEDEQS